MNSFWAHVQSMFMINKRKYVEELNNSWNKYFLNFEVKLKYLALNYKQNN